MPDEYRQYLQNYEKFLANGQKTPEAHTATEDINGSAGDVNVGTCTMPEGNARKRRRIKRAYLRSGAKKSAEDSTPVEFLSEYIAYSDSSGSDSDGTRDALSSPRSDNSSSSNADHCSPKSPSSAVFIGPLPADDVLPAKQLEDTIGPKLPDPITVAEVYSCENLETKPKMELGDPAMTQDMNTSELNRLTQLLLEKFAFLDVHVDKFTPIQLLYVQLSTRFEDWTAGFLPSSRFHEKLEEVNSYLLNYEQSLLPDGWSCKWDSDNKRYLYICKATGASQHHFPHPQPLNADNHSNSLFLAYKSQENADEGTQERSNPEKPASVSFFVFYVSMELFAYWLVTTLCFNLRDLPASKGK
ncbi:unnamed protein product [Dibothriocephalus latus]|uniref:WW domain-containing protein n=1 Tax=Dibothriocephalus latus TaxID=60516 RepID=A0A3P7LG45_DIBLA|nr:unnamed protein product [Dibothriocephalus latus]